MVATSTDTGTSVTGWGTAITGASTGSFGISPTFSKTKELKLPNYDNVPRIHKDKNGCIKTSYWETQPINIQDIGGLAFGVAGSDSYTISTSGVANMTMGDITDDTSALTAADACV